MAVVDIDETEVIGEAHWSVFLPVVMFAILFAGLWLVLDVAGRGASLPGRFAFLVAVLVTPLLTLLSFLRYQTIRVSRSFDGLWIERGWPSMTPRHLPFDSISKVTTGSPLIGGRFGAGKLMLTLSSGDRITVHDLADVERLAQRIRPDAAAEAPGAA
jgi:membrane protein YdbS with pleckstrin-like domain